MSQRQKSALAALAAALGAAFFIAPPLLAVGDSGSGFADRGRFAQALRAAFVEYWRTGEHDTMRAVVDYWFRFHLAKALIATVLLIVLVVLGVQLGKAFLRAGGLGMGRRAVLASAAALVTTLALASLAAVMANIQGAAAPFAALLPMLADGSADAELTGTLRQVRQQFADSRSAGGRTSPALDTMISDFARYHAAMAVVAAVVAVALVGVSVVLWRRFARTAPSDRRTRRVLGSFGVLCALLSLLTIVVAVANAGTAADPTPALQAFFDGGW